MGTQLMIMADNRNVKVKANFFSCKIKFKFKYLDMELSTTVCNFHKHCLPIHMLLQMAGHHFHTFDKSGYS